MLRAILGLILVGGCSAVAFEVKRQSGQSCTVNGMNVQDGQIFDLSAFGPCIKFECRNGEVFPNKYGCERNGQCYPIGDKYNLGCVEKECKVSNGNFAYVSVNEGCSYKDVCLQVDETHKEGCITYKCNKETVGNGVRYSVNVFDWGCERNGQCYAGNTVITDQCKTLKCELINGLVGFRTQEGGCSFQGTCLKVDETYQDGCITYQCQKGGNATHVVYSTKLIDWGCARNGQCYPENTTIADQCKTLKCGLVNGAVGFRVQEGGCSFKGVCLKVNETYQEGCYTYKCTQAGTPSNPVYATLLNDWGCSRNNRCYPPNSTLIENCATLVCEMINGFVGFRPKEAACQHGSTCLKLGETLVEKCKTYTCRVETVNGASVYSTAVTNVECEDANGNCNVPGSTFPYNIGGTIYQTCTCDVLNNNVHIRCS